MKKYQPYQSILISGLIASIATIVWIDFIPFKFHEFWPGVGVKFERLVYSLSSSYIASLLFFVVVDVIRDNFKRKTELKSFLATTGLYLSRLEKHLAEVIETNEKLFIDRNRKPYKLNLEQLVHMYDPPKQFAFYSNFSDLEVQVYRDNRLFRYRNYFYALNKLLEHLKSNKHQLDYFEHYELFEAINVFIILNEEENIEEQVNQRVHVTVDGQPLFKKDIEYIKYFTARIKEEPEYETGLEIHSKELLELYYRFCRHLETNINMLSSFERISKNKA